MRTLPNPFPAGPRFAHNTASKVSSVGQPAPVSVTATEPPQVFKTVTISSEARRIARGLGIREAEYIVQRVLDAETTVRELVARLSQLEQHQVAPHLVEVERR